MDMADLELPQVKLLTGNYDIIDSGCVVLQMGEYLEFRIVNLRFRIVFAESSDGQEGRIQQTVENQGSPDAYMLITFYNQHKAFFSSVSSLSSVATIDGKHLYLKFSIQAINNVNDNSDKIFFYTWYLDKVKESQPTTNASV